MTVEALPSQVLSFLGGCTISLLDVNLVRNGISCNKRERRVWWRVHVRLERKDDGSAVFKLGTRARTILLN